MIRPGLTSVLHFFLFAALITGSVPRLRAQESAEENSSLSPVRSLPLDAELHESSGLLMWDGSLWSHNDSDDPHLYRIDSSSGAIREKILLEGIDPTDWEDIAQDKNNLYVGDFGNNLGNRRDLHILRISKSSILKHDPQIERIDFSYSDQEDYSVRNHANDYDCEAMIVRGDSIILFTKEWITGGTTLYSLPAIPGRHVARAGQKMQIGGLITGADLSANGNTLILCGYNTLMHPFLVRVTDSGSDVIPLALSFHQVEGIAVGNDLDIYLSNERFQMGSLINTPPALHRCVLRPSRDQ